MGAHDICLYQETGKISQNYHQMRFLISSILHKSTCFGCSLEVPLLTDMLLMGTHSIFFFFFFFFFLSQSVESEPDYRLIVISLVLCFTTRSVIGGGASVVLTCFVW